MYHHNHCLCNIIGQSTWHQIPSPRQWCWWLNPDDRMKFYFMWHMV